MLPHSAQMDVALRKSHRIATLCEVWDGNNMLKELIITDGNITASDEEIRRRCDITVVDPLGELVPATAQDLLAPMGNELRLYRGITYDDGTVEMLPQGIFGISDTRIDESGGKLQIGINGYDRARRIKRAKFPYDYSILDGTNVGTGVANLLQLRAPWAIGSLQDTSYTTPSQVLRTGADPWANAFELAASAGMELFFDVDGTYKMRSVFTQTAPVWDFIEGETATFLYVMKRFTDENTFSHAIVLGEGGDTPVRGEAADTDPNSPTYYLGKFGDVVEVTRNSLVSTADQALTVARARLEKKRGLPEQLEVTSIVHPALDIGDSVFIERGRIHVSGTYQIDKMTMPMVAIRAQNISLRFKEMF